MVAPETQRPNKRGPETRHNNNDKQQKKMKESASSSALNKANNQLKVDPKTTGKSVSNNISNNSAIKPKALKKTHNNVDEIIESIVENKISNSKNNEIELNNDGETRLNNENINDSMDENMNDLDLTQSENSPESEDDEEKNEVITRDNDKIEVKGKKSDTNNILSNEIVDEPVKNKQVNKNKWITIKFIKNCENKRFEEEYQKSELKLSKEIKRTWPGLKYFNAHINDNQELVLRVPNDEAIIERINNVTINDAFGVGIKSLKKVFLEKEKNNNKEHIEKYHIVIFRREDIPKDFEEEIKQEYGISNLIKFSQTYKASLDNEVNYKELLNYGRINIGIRSYRVDAWKNVERINICYNCQIYGHRANRCNNETVCMNCAGSHTTKECTSDEVKCSNCDKQHKSNSITCEYLKKKIENDRRRAKIVFENKKSELNKTYKNKNSSNDHQTYKVLSNRAIQNIPIHNVWKTRLDKMTENKKSDPEKREIRPEYNANKNKEIENNHNNIEIKNDQMSQLIEILTEQNKLIRNMTIELVNIVKTTIKSVKSIESEDEREVLNECEIRLESVLIKLENGTNSGKNNCNICNNKNKSNFNTEKAQNNENNIQIETNTSIIPKSQ